MRLLTLQLPKADADYLTQVKYAMSFAAEDIVRYDISADGLLEYEIDAAANEAAVSQKVEKLIQRYVTTQFGLKSEISFRQERELETRDAWTELLERKWIRPVGTGHVILRGPAAELQHMIDAKVIRDLCVPLGAEPEVYPATILCSTLDRCNHFTSFPEHVDFVAHLREDVDVLEEFTELCREGGFQPTHAGERAAPPRFAISPSCCYHCYEAMEGYELEPPGRAVTMTVGCHRYEGKNLEGLSRLRAFTMREIVWLGDPVWVKAQRAKAEEVMIDWAKAWELDCTLETANDLFFTDDYSVKASFQRHQEAKKELRGRIPIEGKSISLFSSNFHSTTFGKEFNILGANGRPCVTACVGWGLERWVYAVFSQFGLDESAWPEAVRDELAAYRQTP